MFAAESCAVDGWPAEIHALRRSMPTTTSSGRAWADRGQFRQMSDAIHHACLGSRSVRDKERTFGQPPALRPAGHTDGRVERPRRARQPRQLHRWPGRRGTNPDIELFLRPGCPPASFHPWIGAGAALWHQAASMCTRPWLHGSWLSLKREALHNKT